MEKSKMQLIKEWIEKCPLLQGGKINVDYLKDDVNSYSIDQSPVQPEVSNFVDGRGGKRQIAFDFTVQAPISSQSIVNLANSKFCEDFMGWVNEQNRTKNFPDIAGAFSIKCTSPRICSAKNGNNSNLYYSNKFYILRVLIKNSIFLYKRRNHKWQQQVKFITELI